MKDKDFMNELNAQLNELIWKTQECSEKDRRIKPTDEQMVKLWKPAYNIARDIKLLVKKQLSEVKKK